MRSLAVGMLLLVTACGSSGSSDPGPSAPPATASSTSPSPAVSEPTGPEAAVEGLMRALDEGDCAAAHDLVVTPADLGCDVVEQAEGSFADEGVDLDEVAYSAGAVEGDSATVTIDWGTGVPGESYEVQRIDGTWRVVFDSAA